MTAASHHPPRSFAGNHVPLSSLAAALLPTRSRKRAGGAASRRLALERERRRVAARVPLSFKPLPDLETFHVR